MQAYTGEKHYTNTTPTSIKINGKSNNTDEKTEHNHSKNEHNPKVSDTPQYFHERIRLNPPGKFQNNDWIVLDYWGYN